jgi:hypothetical protein
MFFALPVTPSVCTGRSNAAVAGGLKNGTSSTAQTGLGHFDGDRCAGSRHGMAFVGIRPRILLLPEDQRYTGLTPDQLRALEPQLFAWMGMVFRSWGAFAIGLGTTVAGLAAFAYRRGEVWAHWLLMIAGVATFSIFLTVKYHSTIGFYHPDRPTVCRLYGGARIRLVRRVARQVKALMAAADRPSTC